MSRARPGPLVLDTHVWVWLLEGDPGLGDEARRAIEGSARYGRVHVPAICVWEVAMLEAKGGIRLAGDCLDWVRQALAQPGLSLAPFTPEIAVASSRLPGDFHGDPADRMIVATARALRAALVTRDARIIAYGGSGHLSVLPA